MSNSGYKFYAVKVGRELNTIVHTWDECEELTKGFKSALFRGFKTKGEAARYLLEPQHNKIKCRVSVIEFADLMEEKLQKHDEFHKNNGMDDIEIHTIGDALENNVGQLKSMIANKENLDMVLEKSADIANCALMISEWVKNKYE